LLDEENAQTALEEACEEGNHPRQRYLSAIDSGRRAAVSNPDPVEDALTNDINLLGTFSRDDIGNANRVAFWRGTDIRYDPNRERFFTWAGKKWVYARDGRVRNIVEDVHSRIVATEAPFYNNLAIPPSEKDKKSPKTYREQLVEWAKTQRYSRKVADTVAMLKGREALWCESDDFDTHPYHFNVSNGVVDLSTGKLLDHDRSFMCSQISRDVTYAPGASAPHWDRFLKLVQPNPIHRKYLQRLIGCTMLGEVVDQIFSVHIGSGGNGKGVFWDVMCYIMGDYATTGQRDSFIRKNNSNRIPADIASMEGKRLVLVDELNDNQKIDEGLLKEISGGSVIKAEAKNMNPWEYTPKFTLHFRTNHMPDLPADPSILRRFRPVKWTEAPTSEEWDTFRDPHHSTPFNFLTKQESSGILNWILEGVEEYLKKGLEPPADLKAEAIDMLEESDPFLIFMAENTTVHQGGRVDAAKLYAAFRDWFLDNTFPGKPPSSRTLYKDLKTGKYKDKWEYGSERQRLVIKDVTLNTLLVK
jgi:putative DNA primase/helicase